MTVPSTQMTLNKAAKVTQTGSPNANGYVKKTKAGGVTEVDVTYTSTCVDNTHSAHHDTSGCFTTSGAVQVDSQSIGTPTGVTNKYRTLQGFSTAAGTKMAGQATFEKYKKYYGG